MVRAYPYRSAISTHGDTGSLGKVSLLSSSGIWQEYCQIISAAGTVELVIEAVRLKYKHTNVHPTCILAK